MEVVRILAIDGNADLNKASSVWDDPGGMNIPHATPLVVAVVNGNVAMCKLLVLFGADAKVGVAGNGAFTLAKFSDVGDVAAFFGAVADWPPLKIAAGCRLHADASRMLHLGAIEPANYSLVELTAVGDSSVNMLWQGSPRPCDETTALIRAAMSSWSPERHALCHHGVRSAVRTVLLVVERLRRRHEFVSTLSQQHRHLLPQIALLAPLPTELWLIVCSYFVRSCWAV